MDVRGAHIQQFTFFVSRSRSVVRGAVMCCVCMRVLCCVVCCVVCVWCVVLVLVLVFGGGVVCIFVSFCVLLLPSSKKKEETFYHRNISGEGIVLHYNFSINSEKNRRRVKLQSLQFQINSKTIKLQRVKSVIILAAMVFIFHFSHFLIFSFFFHFFIPHP